MAFRAFARGAARAVACARAPSSAAAPAAARQCAVAPAPEPAQGKSREVEYPWMAAPYTDTLEPAARAANVPLYRVMDWEGRLLTPSLPAYTPDQQTMLRMHRGMVQLSVIDDLLYRAQRISLISFYMTSTGEEAIHFGSAAALQDTDEVFPQYREPGVFMWRGYTIEEMCNQCAGNELDPAKGRQMPVHYSPTHLHVQTVSSPMATQIPHAVGYAYALRCAGEQRIAVTYFGEGAASEGDCPSAFNFASVLRAPCMFICRNNGFAISTPAQQQYGGDGIAARALSYGIETYRVDGNDLLAVYHVTAHARARIAASGRPALVEMVSYRVGHHSTSDDSSRYREAEEIEYWHKEASPITRFRKYLVAAGLWTPEEEEALRKETAGQVRTALNRASGVPLASIDDLFEDVYDTPPAHLREQRAELHAHLAKYGQHYSLEKFRAPST